MKVSAANIDHWVTIQNDCKHLHELGLVRTAGTPAERIAALRRLREASQLPHVHAACNALIAENHS